MNKKSHIGKRIKEKIKELRIKPVTQMQMNKQTFYNSLKRPTIDTGTLQRFSEALGYNFFLDFISEEEKKRISGSAVTIQEYEKTKALLNQCESERHRQQQRVLFFSAFFVNLWFAHSL